MIEATSPRTVKVIDQFRRDTDRGAAWDGVALDGLIASLDDVLPEGNDIVLFVDIAEPQLPNLIGQLDRALVIGTHSDLETTATWAKKQCSDVRGVLLFDRSMPTMVREVAGIQLGWLGRATEIDRWLPWIARHVAGTKIGLALSAGGAKGFAHLAVLEALERAGYAIDYLAGTSAGATVSALTALGLDARARHNVLQQIFSVENAELLMRGTKNGTSEGLAAIAKLQDEIVGAATFADLEIPTSVLTADLAAKAPVVLHEGGLGLALRAAISVPGMLPPIEKGAQRLVDGVIVSPLPTDIVRDMGADIVIASNVMNRSVLPAWSHAPEAPPKSQGSSRLKMVVDMFDAIEIQQIDNSVRSAEEADIAVSPLFGPGSWKDFHLGEAFYRAGHSMAETVVSRLSELAKPIPMSVTG